MSASHVASTARNRRLFPAAQRFYPSYVSIRVVLGEDSFIVREGLEQVLAAADEVELVASCADFESLLDAVRGQRADVVVTDIRMPPGYRDEGIRFAAALRESSPDVGVVVLSQYMEPAYVMRLFADGTDGRAYLLKDRVHDRRELVGAISTVAAGGSAIDPKVVEVLVESRTRAERSPLRLLTTRELEVLQAIASGKSNVAIAQALVLTKHAVEKHINVIFLKLGLNCSPESDSISKRVKATLLFLAESDLRDGEV